MTIEEAIEHGKEDLEVFGGTHAVFIKMAIKALEKQTPKRPHDTQNQGMYISELDYACPTCLVWFTHKWSFCPNCGQAIDWKKINQQRQSELLKIYKSEGTINICPRLLDSKYNVDDAYCLSFSCNDCKKDYWSKAFEKLESENLDLETVEKWYDENKTEDK